jgi:hypothetical protein
LLVTVYSKPCWNTVSQVKSNPFFQAFSFAREYGSILVIQCVPTWLSRQPVEVNSTKYSSRSQFDRRHAGIHGLQSMGLA